MVVEVVEVVDMESITTAPGGNAKSLGNEMMTISWWIPSLHEMFLYIIVLLVLYLFGSLVYYNEIQMRVTKESACYRDKQSVLRDGTYTVTAKDKSNNSLYRVEYNLAAKQYTLQPACTKGNVVNTFKDIPVYDLQKNSKGIAELTMSCDRALETDNVDDVYYVGHPGLVRFMNSVKDTPNTPNTSFFEGTDTCAK
jgi:hypothetical protein